MKKYLLGIFAIVFAVAFSAFTSVDQSVSQKSDFADVYYVYDEGDQSDPENYTPQPTPPQPCPGAVVLCWFKVPNGIPFLDVFNTLDTNDDGEINSDDAISENSSTVQLKS